MRLVIPSDLRGGRYVSNIAFLQIVTVPQAATALLLGAGAAVLWLGGWTGRRRERGAA